MSDQETIVIQDDAEACESYEEEMANSQSQLINFAGQKLEQLISTDIENFTEEALVLCKIATSNVVPKQKSQEQLANAVQHLQTQVKEDISKFTEEVQSIGQIEAEFNERAKLLLQCHNMSSYITACLMEKFRNKGNA